MSLGHDDRTCGEGAIYVVLFLAYEGQSFSFSSSSSFLLFRVDFFPSKIKSTYTHLHSSSLIFSQPFRQANIWCRDSGFFHRLQLIFTIYDKYVPPVFRSSAVTEHYTLQRLISTLLLPLI